MEQFRESLARIKALTLPPEKVEKENKTMGVLMMINHGLTIYVAIVVTVLAFLK